MSKYKKVKYAKHCRHHEHVKRVKAMLTKAMKQVEGLDILFWWELTGVLKPDHDHLKFMIREGVNKLCRGMQERHKESMEELSCDFPLSTWQLYIKWLNDLEVIKDYIYRNYPDEWQSVTYEFTNPDAPSEEKGKEYIRHCEKRKLIGYNQQHFATHKDGTERQLFTLTATHHDLLNVTHIKTEYQ
jgi:hypothetical protein